ncbi:HAD family hydrolase [Paenibacillus glycinis]|nr:HAD family hydrolase [Paenibacillus glycinis]
MKEIRVLVFDLDGTLYQDENFIRPYLTYLFQDGDESVVSRWQTETERILKGEHPVKVGHFFSKAHKSGVRHKDGQPLSLYDWEGMDVEHPIESLRHSEGEMHYIGDSWGVLGAIAELVGIPPAVRSQAFLSVRRDMIGNLNSITPHEGVNAAIRGLKSIRHKLLMTNSPEEAAVGFVAKLGLENAFDTVVYGGNKPDGLIEYLRRYMNENGIAPGQIASIGDNAWNELYPIKRMGGRTVLVSRYETHDEEAWDLRIRTLDELAAFLLQLESDPE